MSATSSACASYVIGLCQLRHRPMLATSPEPLTTGCDQRKRCRQPRTLSTTAMMRTAMLRTVGPQFSACCCRFKVASVQPSALQIHSIIPFIFSSGPPEGYTRENYDSYYYYYSALQAIHQDGDCAGECLKAHIRTRTRTRTHHIHTTRTCKQSDVQDAHVGGIDRNNVRVAGRALPEHPL
jgi:hypothetical protein